MQVSGLAEQVPHLQLQLLLIQQLLHLAQAGYNNARYHTELSKKSSVLTSFDMTVNSNLLHFNLPCRIDFIRHGSVLENILVLLLLLEKVSSARLGESGLHPISPKTPAPQY